MYLLHSFADNHIHDQCTHYQRLMLSQVMSAGMDNLVGNILIVSFYWRRKMTIFDASYIIQHSINATSKQ